MPDTLVSVVIPVWRDELALQQLLGALARKPPEVELIVAVVLGEESRYVAVREQHPEVSWMSAPRGRACQMNAGARTARGRWLLFLHADSRLPPDWLDIVWKLDPRDRVVGGAFAFRLDSDDWRARFIEFGARLRVRVMGLPYGDQALFVRRSVFEAIGGYRDLPLMEDIDFVRRVTRLGRLVHVSSAVVTSARRWTHEGWMRRSASNALLATRFLFGASPSRLAQQYFGRHHRAVVMMARAPWTRGKTRLEPAAPAEAHESLRYALLFDTLDVMIGASAAHIIACDPADACERLRQSLPPSIDVIAQRGNDLGERLARCFEDVFRLGSGSIVVLGSDLPDLPTRLIDDAFTALQSGRDRVVLGPASDGGYYLIGMNKPHAELFAKIDWSTPRVLAQTLSAARSIGVETVLLDQWRDVDEPAALKQLMRQVPPSAAMRTRAWGDAWLRDP